MRHPAEKGESEDGKVLLEVMLPLSQRMDGGEGWSEH